MQDAPDVDMIVPLDIEDEVGKSRDPAGAEARQFQLMRKSRRSRAGLCGNGAKGGFERTDEVQRNIGPGRFGIMIDRRLDILTSQGAGNDGLCAHLAMRLPARSRRVSK